MLKNKTKLIVAVVFSFVSILAVSKFSPALALPLINPNIIKPKFTVVKLLWGARCSAVEKNVDKKIDKFEENKEKHYQRYILLLDRLETRLEGWKEMGYNVDILEEDMDKLNDKMDKFNADYKIYIEKLEAARDITCESTEADYISALQEAKTAIKNVRKDVVDIKTFYWNMIRKHILTLKDQKIYEEE